MLRTLFCKGFPNTCTPSKMEEIEIHIIYLSIIVAILLYLLLSKIGNTPKEDTIFGLFNMPNEAKKGKSRSQLMKEAKIRRKSHLFTYRERKRLSSSGNNSWFHQDLNIASSSTGANSSWYGIPASSQSLTDQVVSGQMTYREWSQQRANSQEILMY